MTVKKKKPRHVHKWPNMTGEIDVCRNCGFTEVYCDGCGALGLFNSKGKLVKIIK